MYPTRLFVPAALAILAACSAEYRLENFSPPDQSFVSAMPAPVEHKSTAIDSPDGAGTIHSYSVTFDEVMYGVNVIDLPEQAKEEIKHPLKAKLISAAANQAMLAMNRWKLLEEVGDMMDLSPSRRIYGQKITAATADSASTVTVRIFLHNGRAYQAMTIVPKKHSYNQGVYSMRFLDSFKLKDST